MHGLFICFKKKWLLWLAKRRLRRHGFLWSLKSDAQPQGQFYIHTLYFGLYSYSEHNGVIQMSRWHFVEREVLSFNALAGGLWRKSSPLVVESCKDIYIHHSWVYSSWKKNLQAVNKYSNWIGLNFYYISNSRKSHVRVIQ